MKSGMLNLGRLLWWKLFGWLVGCGCGKHYVMIPRAEGDDQPLAGWGMELPNYCVQASVTVTRFQFPSAEPQKVATAGAVTVVPGQT